VRRARRPPAKFGYLLFTGSRVVLVRAEPVLDAAGSPASGEEGFAPAGSFFAAGVLAFAAAVPAVASRHWGCRQLATTRSALPPGRALRQKSTSWTRLQRKGRGVGGVTFYASR
jgi:hypothetical protein